VKLPAPALLGVAPEPALDRATRTTDAGEARWSRYQPLSPPCPPDPPAAACVADAHPMRQAGTGVDRLTPHAGSLVAGMDGSTDFLPPPGLASTPARHSGPPQASF